MSRYCTGCDKPHPDNGKPYLEQDYWKSGGRSWWHLGPPYFGFFCPECANLLHPDCATTPDPQEVIALKVKLKLKQALR